MFAQSILCPALPIPAPRPTPAPAPGFIHQLLLLLLLLLLVLATPYGAEHKPWQLCISNWLSMCVAGSTTPILMSYGRERKH